MEDSLLVNEDSRKRGKSQLRWIVKSGPDPASAQDVLGQEVLEDLIEAMKDYADEYLGEIEPYGKNPNRAHHLPYIKAIASCKNDWEIKMLLEVQ